MARSSKVEIENAVPQEPLAIELANLRHYFSPASVFGAGMPSEMDRAAMGDTLADRRSPLPLDNAFVQQTKDQIRATVENIAKLAHAPIEPNEFVLSVLPKIASAMGASGAALWQQFPDLSWRLLGNLNLPIVLLDVAAKNGSEIHAGQAESTAFEQLDFLESQLRTATESMPTEEFANKASGRLKTTCLGFQWEREAPAELGFGSAGASPFRYDGNCRSPKHISNGPQPSDSHLSVLNAVARERQPILIPPCDALLNRDRPENPTSELLIYAPLPIPTEQGNYWLQIVQSPSGGPSSHRGYLRFVAQMADLMSDYFRSHRLRVFERDREYLSLAEHTMNELAGSLNPKLGVAKLMKNIREHAQSEHAFLLRRESYFGRWRVVGAAGLVEIDRRAQGIGQIERASSSFHSMFRQGGAFSTSQISGGVDERDPDLTRLFNTFAITELQWIKPLVAEPTAPRNPTHSAVSNSTSGQMRPVKLDVAVLLTWSGMDKPPSRCFEQSGLIARLGLSALQVPWWKSALLASQTTNRSVLAIANPASWPRTVKWLVSLTILSLLFALPVPIRLHATAVLVPLVQQHVYAPMDATVEAVLVEHGQAVKLGDPLIQLRSPSLSAEYEQTMAQQLRTAQRFEEIEARLLRETALTPAQQEELAGEKRMITSGRPNEMKQLELLRKQIDSLCVVANVDGIVSTWNVQDSLRDRPLRTGQWLLSLHESDSPWILEAALPERDAQEFRIAIENDRNPPVATMTSMPQIQLPVHLRRAARPRIESGQKGEVVSDPNSAVLRLRFEVDAESLPAQVAVAGATARISIPVGRGPLIWALGKDFAHQVWARVQLWI